MNPTTPKNYDIEGHNDSACWKNMMGNLGCEWSPREKAQAYRWWNEDRPADENGRLILDSFQAPNGYSPLLGIEGSSDYMSAHAKLARQTTRIHVQKVLDEATQKKMKLKEIRNLLESRRCELPGLLDILAGETVLPQKQMLEIVIPDVCEYIKRLTDTIHGDLCIEYLKLFFEYYGDRTMVIFGAIANEVNMETISHSAT